MAVVGTGAGREGDTGRDAGVNRVAFLELFVEDSENFGDGGDIPSRITGIAAGIAEMSAQTGFHDATLDGGGVEIATVGTFSGIGLL